MSLFKKSKELKSEVPQLPDIPEPQDITNPPDIPDLPEFNHPTLPPPSSIPDTPEGLPHIETHSLPSISDHDERDKFEKDTIKKTINSPEPKLQKSIGDADILQSESLADDEPISPPHEEPEESPLQHQETVQKPIRKEKIKEPVFIRLDKFQTTIDTFDTIRDRIKEIEDLLINIKDIKSKEDQELVEWENEIQVLKTRIDLIDKNIFSKMD